MGCRAAADHAHIAGNTAAKTEGIDFAGWEVSGRRIPRRIGISAEDRQNRAGGDGRIIPAGYAVERHIEPTGDGELFELEDVPFSTVRGSIGVFILKLDADDGASVFPEKAVELLANSPIKTGHIFEIRWIVDSCRSFGDEPVWKATVAGLAMCPWPDPGIEIHMMFGTELRESTKIPVASPVELSFDLFVMNPDHVGRDDVDARSLHFENLLLPFVGWNSGEVEFAHHGKPGFFVEGEIALIQSDDVSVRTLSRSGLK